MRWPSGSPLWAQTPAAVVPITCPHCLGRPRGALCLEHSSEEEQGQQAGMRWQVGPLLVSCCCLGTPSPPQWPLYRSAANRPLQAPRCLMQSTARFWFGFLGAPSLGSFAPCHQARGWAACCGSPVGVCFVLGCWTVSLSRQAQLFSL